ncbi:MAG: LamG domain-containing protein [Akkermansiaceae bacterium]
MNNKMDLPSLSFTAVALLLFSGITHADLIGHWKFDEGEGAVAADSSAAGNDGAIFEATWGSDGRFENYLIFDGDNDQVDPEVPLPVMTATNDFTWAVWFNSQAIAAGSQNNSIILGNRVALDGSDSTPRQFIKLTARNFEWHQNDNGNDNLDFEDELIVVDQWHHVAVVKTGAQLEFFLDGVATQTQALTEAIGTEQNPFLIGGHERVGAANTHNEFFNGFIADVRIYDEALSAAAVKAVYDENAPVVVEPEELAITNIIRNENNDIELTWFSKPDFTYALEISTGLTETGQPGDWAEAVDAIPSGGETTTFTLLSSLLPTLDSEDKLFFRIVEEEVVIEE